jgi:hypothetical protein
MLAVICRECWTPTKFARVAPKLCPECGKDPRWMPLPPEPAPPKDAYKETVYDQRFLRSLRIKPQAVEAKERKPPA